MGLGKKNRGKQRKAAKQQTTVAAVSTLTASNLNQLVVYTPKNETYVHPDHHELVDAYFQRADRKATEILASLTSDNVPTHGICWPNISLGGTILCTLLYHFIGKCEDYTFDKVLADRRVLGSLTRDAIKSGGDLRELQSPSLWIKVLCRAAELEPSCQVDIAVSIDPLVRCMGNDTERHFFKSNKHWKEGVETSVSLVYNMIINNTDEDNLRKKVIKAFLEYDEDFITTFVKIGFWKDQRPDIVELLSVEKCIEIAAFGRAVVGKLVTNAADNLSEENRRLLNVIGCMPIVSKDYNPNCMMSFTAGLITRWMQEEESEEEFFLSKEGWRWKDPLSLRDGVLDILRPLVEEVDCVDKDVIKGMIGLGTNYVHDYACAVVVARLSENMLCKYRPSDTRIALAIRSGLVEMCLCFIERFGEHEYFGDEVDSLYSHVDSIFYRVHGVSLHEKSRKAIRNKIVDIREKLHHSKEIIDISNNQKCKKLLGMVLAILDSNGSYCCRCNKSLCETEVKVCNGCNRMTYCSRACQRDDWLNGGHKLNCCKSFTAGLEGKFQGRKIPPTSPENERAATKVKELETNLNMIQLKLLVDNSDTILSQASSLKIPLCDCVVKFDLRKCHPTVEVYKYTDVYVSPEQLRKFEEMRSKENITCTYYTNFFHGGNSEDKVVMQGIYPHAWISKQSGQCST